MSDDEGCCVMSVITHVGPAASTGPSTAGNEAGRSGGPRPPGVSYCTPLVFLAGLLCSSSFLGLSHYLSYALSPSPSPPSPLSLRHPLSIPLLPLSSPPPSRQLAIYLALHLPLSAAVSVAPIRLHTSIPRALVRQRRAARITKCSLCVQLKFPQSRPWSEPGFGLHVMHLQETDEKVMGLVRRK